MVSDYWTGDFWTDVVITIFYIVVKALAVGAGVYFGIRVAMREEY